MGLLNVPKGSNKFDTFSTNVWARCHIAIRDLFDELVDLDEERLVVVEMLAR